MRIHLLIRFLATERSIIDAIPNTRRQPHEVIASLLLEEFGMSYKEEELHKSLSNREYEVIRAIASGKNVKEAAWEMSLNSKMINTNLARSMKKLYVKTNAEHMRYAKKQKLAD